MTNRIDRLEHDRLVTRLPDPADRRGVLVELTRRGHGLIDRVLVLHVENEEGILAGLSQREREALTDLLRKLLVSLEARPEAKERKAATG